MDWSIVFGGAVLGSCIGVFGAAANAFFQRRFERRKWYADFFVRPKVETLRALHGAAVGCQMQLLAIPHKPGAARMWKNAAERQARYDGAKTLLDELTRTILAAGIYLTDADLSLLFKFRDAFYSSQIRGHFEPIDTDNNDVGAEAGGQSQSAMADNYRQVESRLRELLYPQAVLLPLVGGKSFSVR